MRTSPPRAAAGIRPGVWAVLLLLSLALWAGLIAGACFVVAFVLN